MKQRAFTRYRITGTESGRTSTSVVKPPDAISQFGLALQTLSKHDDVNLDVGIEGLDIRSMFIADPGYVFLEWDYSGAEDWVVQVLAKNWEALKYRTKKDYIRNSHGCKNDRHTLTAASCLSKNWEDITDYDRQIGKKTRHAGNYAMGKHQAMLNFAKYGVFMSEWKCGQLLEKFHAANPEIKQIFHKDIQDSLAANNCVLYSPHGRRRVFMNRWGDELFKEAYAQIPQATVSDANKFSLVRIRKQLPKVEFEICAESHDSGLALAKEDCVKDFVKVIKKEAEEPIDFNGCTLKRDYQLVIPVEFKIGKIWSELKDLKV